MSSIPQNHSDEKALIDCVQRFFSKHHVGKLLARCNGMKEKGVSPVSLFRYKLSNIFVGRRRFCYRPAILAPFAQLYFCPAKFTLHVLSLTVQIRFSVQF